MNILERFENYIQGDAYKVTFGSNKSWPSAVRHYVKFQSPEFPSPEFPDAVRAFGEGDTLEEAVDQAVTRLEGGNAKNLSD